MPIGRAGSYDPVGQPIRVQRVGRAGAPTEAAQVDRLVLLLTRSTNESHSSQVYGKIDSQIEQLTVLAETKNYVNGR